ncbi:MAG TPA: GNAT family N-acetyltransferase [Micromonosporaceae bacterium]
MPTLSRDDGYVLSTDPDRIDIDRVYRWLSTDAYWAIGRSRETVARAFEGSMPFGVYRPGDGVQVAVGRVVTDGATFAWLCDVYVEPSERGKGLGRWLATAVRDQLADLGVRRILLATADAHAVYAGAGFTPLAKPGQWMELDRRPVTIVTSKEHSPEAPLTVQG